MSTTSPRASGSMPARVEDVDRGLGGARQRAQGRAQGLAALGERRVDDPEDVLAGHGGGRRVAPGPGDQAGVDVGRRPEDVAPDRAGPAYVGEPGGLDRGDAVDLGAGRRRQPVGHLGLHHHQAALEARQQRQQVQQDGDRDVVGQVGDQRGGGRAGYGGQGHRVRGHQRRSGRPPRARGWRSWPAGPPRARRRSRRRPRGRPSRAGPGSASRAPGPTSTTTSSGPTPASRTIRRTVLASMTKFCPRCLVGRRSSSAARARTSAGPSRRTPSAPGVGDVTGVAGMASA